MDRVITSHDYQDMKGRVDKDNVLSKDKLTDLQQEVSPFRIFIQKASIPDHSCPEYIDHIKYMTKGHKRKQRLKHIHGIIQDRTILFYFCLICNLILFSNCQKRYQIQILSLFY